MIGVYGNNPVRELETAAARAARIAAKRAALNARLAKMAEAAK